MTQPALIPMPEPPDGALALTGEGLAYEAYERDDKSAAEEDWGDARWWRLDMGSTNPLTWQELLDKGNVVRLHRADDAAVAVLPEAVITHLYTDPVVQTQIRASACRFGANQPDADLQLTMTDQHIERAVCVRLPGDVAEEFLLSALAQLRAARRAAAEGTVPSVG